jgi:hypothetical protein
MDRIEPGQVDRYLDAKRGDGLSPKTVLARRSRPRLAHPATGHVLDASTLRKRFRVALARARAPDLTFHELRHTFGTQMAAAGAPLRAVQESMGHADASTTEVYAHYAPDPTGGAAFAQRAFGSGIAAPAPVGDARFGDDAPRRAPVGRARASRTPRRCGHRARPSPARGAQP